MLRRLWQPLYRLYAIRKNVRHGRGLHLGLGTIVDASRGMTIGDDVYIGKGCTIEVDGRIGDGVLIANRVGLVGRNDHDKRAVGVTIRRAPWIGDPHFDEALRQEDYVLAVNTALVRRMNELCLARGIGFVVAAFPDQLSYRRKSPLLKRFFDGLAHEGIRILDMSERFRGLNLRLRDVALDPAGHLSPRGHAIVSQVLESELALPVRASRRASEPPPPRLQ